MLLSTHKVCQRVCYVPMSKAHSDHLNMAKSVEPATSQSLLRLTGTSLATGTSEKQLKRASRSHLSSSAVSDSWFQIHGLVSISIRVSENRCCVIAFAHCRAFQVSPFRVPERTTVGIVLVGDFRRYALEVAPPYHALSVCCMCARCASQKCVSFRQTHLPFF